MKYNDIGLFNNYLTGPNYRSGAAKPLPENPSTMDQESRIMAKDGYPNLGLESYTEGPKIYEGDSITDLRNAAIERLMPDMGLKASINFTENMSIEFLKDILSLDPKTSIAGGYTKDGFTVGGRYEYPSIREDWYTYISYNVYLFEKEELLKLETLDGILDLKVLMGTYGGSLNKEKKIPAEYKLWGEVWTGSRLTDKNYFILLTKDIDR